jgi:hypothetical protein
MTALLTALAGLLALWLRGHLSPEGFVSLSPWLSFAALALQFAGYRFLLMAQEGRVLARGLAWSQAGWILFGLSLPGIWAAQGALDFILLQVLLCLPLQALLKGSHWRRPWPLLAAFLALVGCIPFFSFQAYFQTFIPLMGSADGVSNMQQKLFSQAGLVAAVTLLSVLYQTGALGYFYWRSVLKGAADAPEKPAKLEPSTALLWLGLGLCLAMGLRPAQSSAALHAALQAMGYSN